MELVITLNQNELRLEIRHLAPERDNELKPGRKSALFKGGVDIETARYYHDIGDVLISTLDKLLKRNKLTPSVIKSYTMQGNLGADSTSYKIAAAFVEALKFRDIRGRS